MYWILIKKAILLLSDPVKVDMVSTCSVEGELEYIEINIQKLSNKKK